VSGYWVTCWIGGIVIAALNSRFLQRPQNRSRRNPLISRLLSQTKSIDPQSQADDYGGRCWELRRGGRLGEQNECVDGIIEEGMDGLG